MLNYIYIFQIVISVMLIGAVILQAREAGVGGVFGGGSTTSFRTRRGVEKRLYQATIVLAVIFIVLSLVAVKLVALQ